TPRCQTTRHPSPSGRVQRLLLGRHSCCLLSISYVSPRLAPYDSRDTGLCHPVFFCEILLPYPTRCIPFSDTYDLLGHKPVHVVFHAPLIPLSPPLYHVLRVIPVRAGDQVRGIDARGVITSVSNHAPLGDRSDPQGVGESVRGHYRPVDGEFPVSLSRTLSQPLQQPRSVTSHPGNRSRSSNPRPLLLRRVTWLGSP